MRKITSNNIIIGILVLALVVFNIVIPVVKHQAEKQKLSQVSVLASQLQLAKNVSEKKNIAQAVTSVTGNKGLKALSASADFTASNGASTTGGCSSFIDAINGIYSLYANGSLDPNEYIRIQMVFLTAYDECTAVAVLQ